MFIIVKYGNNESLICNPSCAVVNLLASIKRRAGFGNTNIHIDLSDETGRYIFHCLLYVYFILPAHSVFSNNIQVFQ